MIDSLILKVPDCYYDARQEICAWNRPASKLALVSFLRGMSSRYEPDFVTLTGKIITSFILLQDHDSLTFTYFTPIETKLSNEEIIHEFARFARNRLPNLKKLTISLPLDLPNDLPIFDSGMAEIENKNWLIRISAPKCQENAISLCVLTEQNIDQYLQSYSEICSKYPSCTVPNRQTLLNGLSDVNDDRDTRDRAVLIRNNDPVGNATYEHLAVSGTVIDFYGFASFHPQNTRSLYSLIADRTNASHLCGVKQPRHLNHLKKVLSEVTTEIILSHSRTHGNLWTKKHDSIA